MSVNLKDFEKPEYFVNRELSWLKFDERVLSEARDKTLPLFERLKFLSITSSNLDEFFMVRVASLKDQVHAGYEKPDIAGLTPKDQLKQISITTHDLVKHQYSTLRRSILPALEKAGLHVVEHHEDFNEKQAEFIDRYFEDNVYPVLTPMAMDSSRPFPLIRNKTLNIGLLIEKKDKKKNKEILEFATVQVPSVLPRLVMIPSDKEGDKTVTLMEEVIERNIGKLFLGNKVVCANPYRIMRNADLSIEEEGAEDLLEEIEKQLKKRQWGEVIRLEVEEKADPRLLKILKKEFEVKEEDIFPIAGPIDLTMLMKVYGLEGFGQYKESSYAPPQPVAAFPAGKDVFSVIREGDVFLHHPYMSFDPVVSFVKQAAKDPDVLAIKQTLYRVSGNSPIIKALAQAAENGKQVSVLVELKARFDEENNIVWAKMLEKAGCHVIYGLLGLKTHSKITLVVRREETGIRRYVHLATGNYNDSTAKLYTDCGICTCDERFGEDATAVFNMLSGYSEPKHWNKLIVAPLWMKDRFVSLIGREAENAKKGLPAKITAKMNSLCDPVIISALYHASSCGVEINLLVRGICCLKVGIPGISENIHVRSIVGNFLEHARIFDFCNAGDDEFYMGSADWMPRNLDRRVEIVFPVEDDAIKKKLAHILELEFADNVKAHLLQPDGTYEKPDKRGKIQVNSQLSFCEEEVEKTKEIKRKEKAENERVFVPAEPAQDLEEENAAPRQG